jgi:hypothetical protein
MKALVLLFALVCAATAFAQEEEARPVRLSGVLSLRIFPGRPNYESVEKGDEAEEAWILTVAKEKKEEFQLVVLDAFQAKFAAFHRSLGKKIAVEGLMWEGHTGHHHTPFLITVRVVVRNI